MSNLRNFITVTLLLPIPDQEVPLIWCSINCLTIKSARQFLSSRMLLWGMLRPPAARQGDLQPMWRLRSYSYPCFALNPLKCLLLRKIYWLKSKVGNNESVDSDFLSRHSSQSTQVNWSRKIGDSSWLTWVRDYKVVRLLSTESVATANLT